MDLRDMTKFELQTEFFKASDAYFDMVAQASLFDLIGKPAYQAAKYRLMDAANEMTRRKKIK